MTDRINALTVVLERDVRDDDVEPLLTSIQQLRGVLRVDPHVAESLSDAFVAESRVKREIREHLLSLYDQLR